MLDDVLTSPDEDELVLLLAELVMLPDDELVELTSPLEVELDEVEEIVPDEDEVDEPPVDDEVDEPPVEEEVDEPPVEVEEPPVEVDEPPVDVEDPPVDEVDEMMMLIPLDVPLDVLLVPLLVPLDVPLDPLLDAEVDEPPLALEVDPLVDPPLDEIATPLLPPPKKPPPKKPPKPPKPPVPPITTGTAAAPPPAAGKSATGSGGGSGTGVLAMLIAGGGQMVRVVVTTRRTFAARRTATWRTIRLVFLTCATRGLADSATCTAPPPITAPPQAQAHSFAKAIRTDITLPFCRPAHLPGMPRHYGQGAAIPTVQNKGLSSIILTINSCPIAAIALISAWEGW